jgi:hypothetical protein
MDRNVESISIGTDIIAVGLGDFIKVYKIYDYTEITTLFNLKGYYNVGSHVQVQQNLL